MYTESAKGSCMKRIKNRRRRLVQKKVKPRLQEGFVHRDDTKLITNVYFG